MPYSRGSVSVFFPVWGCVALVLLGYSLLTGAQVAAPYSSSLFGILGNIFLVLACVFFTRPDWDWGADTGLQTRADDELEAAEERTKANEVAFDKELTQDYRVEDEGMGR